jgi:probable rRNA maturation factor
VIIVQKRIAGLDEAALECFVLRARHATGLKATVNVLVTSSAELRTLNRQFRGKNKATDVLSFPAPLPSPPRRSGLRPRLAGEIAVSADIAAKNAVQLGHSAAEEVKVLVLHGILHLAGFDHERDNGQMARKELKLRRQLKLPVGLTERMQQPDPARTTFNRRGRKERSAAARRTP